MDLVVSVSWIILLRSISSRHNQSTWRALEASQHVIGLVDSLHKGPIYTSLDGFFVGIWKPSVTFFMTSLHHRGHGAQWLLIGYIVKFPTLIARFKGPTWGPSGADRTQMGPMLAPWTLLSGQLFHGDHLQKMLKKTRFHIQPQHLECRCQASCIEKFSTKYIGTKYMNCFDPIKRTNPLMKW